MLFFIVLPNMVRIYLFPDISIIIFHLSTLYVHIYFVKYRYTYIDTCKYVSVYSLPLLITHISCDTPLYTILYPNSSAIKSFITFSQLTFLS